MKNNLREFRKKVLGMTQKEASACLGITSVTFGQCERGDKDPSGPTITRLCKSFDCTATIGPEGTLEFKPVNGIEASREAARISLESFAEAHA